MLLALASLNRNIHLFFLTYTRVVFGSLSPCSCNAIAINATTSKPYINAALTRDVCVCPVQAFWFLVTSALPEEILKYFAISLFSYRSYVADPDAIMTLAIASGAGFALAENILYAAQANNIFVRFLLPFPMHVVCQMITGTYIAKRKFIYKEIGQTYSCSWDCSGKLPWYVIILPGILIHSIHNFSLKVMDMSTNVVWNKVFPNIIVLLNLGASFAYLRLKYLELSDIPRVNVRKMQILGWLPNACCFYCYEGESRQRRLDSVYEMSSKIGEIKTETEYQAPLVG